MATAGGDEKPGMKVYGFDLVPWPFLEKASYYADSNRLYDPVRGQKIYEEHLELMALFEEYGFDAVCMNEHHAKPYGLMPSPNLMAAALTQRTKKIKLAIFGNLPALHANPIRLAEEVARPTSRRAWRPPRRGGSSRGSC